MTKYFKIIFLVMIFVILGVSMYNFMEKMETHDTPDTSSSMSPAISASGGIDTEQEDTEGNEEVSIPPTQKEELSSQAASEKYKTLNTELLYKQSIEKGDSFFIENKLIAALQNYQKAKRLNPEDKNLDVRLGDVYFELKNFKLAFKHFKGNDDIVGFSKKKEVLSLFYGSYLLDDTAIQDIKTEIQDIDMNEYERVYYLNSLQCAIDFSKCKKYYQDYFSLEKSHNVPLEELKKLGEGIEAYQGSGIDDLNFKNALIIGKFFENRHYAMVIKLGGDLLTDFPDYAPVVQMVAQSYYELGLYEFAENILKPFHEKNLADANVSYFLGIINMKRKYFLSSNIYFNKALTSGYEPKIDVERKLTYNYFLLGNKEKMYSILDQLLYNEGAEVSDFSLGIYQLMRDGRLNQALNYTKRGSVAFPQESRFYGYAIDIYLQQGRIFLAKEAAEKGKQINPKDRALVFYEGLIYKEEKAYNKAFIAFKRVISMNAGLGGEFVEEAKAELKEIELLKET